LGGGVVVWRLSILGESRRGAGRAAGGPIEEEWGAGHEVSVAAEEVRGVTRSDGTAASGIFAREVKTHNFNMFRDSFMVVALVGLILTQQGLATDKQNCVQPQTVTDSTYRPGQVWSYKTRPGESSSTLTILRVESLGKIGIIVHVRIEGFQFRNCSGGPAPTTLEHAPFTKAALDNSVKSLLKTAPEVPDYKAGYDEWLSHCGGAYSISVAEVLEVDDTAFNSGLGCNINRVG
jgi:hypothetical protein